MSTSTSNTNSNATPHVDADDNNNNTTTMPPPGSIIKIDPARAAVLQANLQSIQQRISAASSPSSSSQHQPLNQSVARERTPPASSDPASFRSVESSSRSVRLVAVSKLKPASDILALHSPPTSHEHFGENYVQELLEKARLLPKTIKWHFIGGLQSNKAAQLAREVDGLWAVESVDSVKKATLLDKGRAERNERVKENRTKEQTRNGNEQQQQQQQSSSQTQPQLQQPQPQPHQSHTHDLEPDPLRVFIQVNTSGESSKSGVSPLPPTDSSAPSSSSSPSGSGSDDLVTLAKHIISSCPNLQLQGLMTIGAIARSRATTAETENEDFICLRDTRDRLAEVLGLACHELELSMGMSEDFEGAIRQGSSEVRVGSTIFGERPAKKDAKIVT